MKNLNELYKQLENHSNFDQDDNCEIFLDTVDEIILRGNPDSITELIKYLDDTTEYSWVIQSMIKSMEHYEIDSYVKEITKNIQFLKNNSIEWLETILCPILNEKKYIQALKKHMMLAPKNCILEIFDIMEKKSPHHAGLIQELKKERESLS